MNNFTYVHHQKTFFFYCNMFLTNESTETITIQTFYSNNYLNELSKYYDNIILMIFTYAAKYIKYFLP